MTASAEPGRPESPPTEEPVTPEGSFPAPTPAAAPAPTLAPVVVSAPIDWLWCPRCLLVTEKPGICHGCDQPFQPAPSWGIPYAPYKPLPPPEVRTRGLVILSTIFLVLVGLGVGVWFLVRSGSPIDGGTKGGDLTALAVPALSGSVTLPGTWVPDTEAGDSLRNVASQISNGGAVRSEVAVRKGKTVLAIASAPVPDPAAIVRDSVVPTPTNTPQEDGTIVSLSASQQVQINGQGGVYTDVEVKPAPSRDPLPRLRVYYIGTKSKIIIIRAIVPADTADQDLAAIHSALIAIR